MRDSNPGSPLYWMKHLEFSTLKLLRKIKINRLVIPSLSSQLQFAPNANMNTDPLSLKFQLKLQSELRQIVDIRILKVGDISARNPCTWRICDKNGMFSYPHKIFGNDLVRDKFKLNILQLQSALFFVKN